MRGQTCNVFLFKKNLSLRRWKLACDEVKEGGFSRPILSDDGGKLPCLKLTVEVRNSLELSKILIKAPYLQQD